MANATIPSLISYLALAVSSLTAISYYPGFNVASVADLTQSLPTHSWDFGSAPFPVPSLPLDLVPALSYAADKIVIGTGFDALALGEGATGDPASLGVSAVMLGKTKGGEAWKEAANQTVDALLNQAPRYWNGAISQRISDPELWTDWMYMVPPFLAFYATDNDDLSLLQEAVAQCGLYRQVLQPDAKLGLWQHIIGPESQDAGFWSTGNASAAAGMSRVLATVIKAPVALTNATWQNQASTELTGWIKEILDGMLAAIDSLDGGLLANYIDAQQGDPRAFGEVSGSSLLAETIYRMAILQPSIFAENLQYITWADGIRVALGGVDGNGAPHITETGIATPAVNPYGWSDTMPFTAGSPEGQAFVLLMYSAWRDCLFAGICAKEGQSAKTAQRRLRHSANLAARSPHTSSSSY